MRAIVIATAVALGASPAIAAAPSLGLPTDAFVATWTALPVSHFVEPDRRTGAVALVRPKALTTVKDGLLDDAIASANDPAQRRDVTLLELSTSWSQPERTALETAREGRERYASSRPTAGDEGQRFVDLIRQIADGAVRSTTSDPAVGSGPDVSAAFESALDRTPLGQRDRLRDAQTAWLAYREAVLTLAAARAPGLIPQIRRELGDARSAELAAR